LLAIGSAGGCFTGYFLTRIVQYGQYRLSVPNGIVFYFYLKKDRCHYAQTLNYYLSLIIYCYVRIP